MSRALKDIPRFPSNLKGLSCAKKLNPMVRKQPLRRFIALHVYGMIEP